MPLNKPEMPTELEMLKKEYHAFINAVSHDYSSALRHIENFSHLILDDLDNPNEEIQKYMGFVDQSIKKIHDMQNALLSLARLETNKDHWVHVNCNTVLEDILPLLTEDFSPDTYTIDLNDLPTVFGDPHLIKVALFHLLHNAFQYHLPESKSKNITLFSDPHDASGTLCIKDNGIGFDEKYASDVFNIFKRLRAQEYDGIGAGLTIARKIAQLHGGRIWVDPKPGAGSTFFLSFQNQ